MERGFLLHNVDSNNEADYVALSLGLEWCLANGIACLTVHGDSMLIVNTFRGFGLITVIISPLGFRQSKGCLKDLMKCGFIT